MSKALVNGSPPYSSAGLLDQYAFGWPTGNIWWVDSVNGTDAVPPQGKTPNFAFATLAYAITQASANNGDWIICREGHSETLTGAAQINVNKAGLTIIGEGYGRNRPIFNYTTSAAASFDINSANCRMANLVFTPIGVATVTAAINVKAADCQIEDCEIEIANGTNQAVIGILTTSAADRFKPSRLWIHGTVNNTTTPIKIVGTTDTVVKDCDIFAACVAGTGCITVGTTAAINLLIDKCRLVNQTASSTKAFTDAITGSTGLISNSQFGILSGSTPLTCATMYRLNNFYAAAVNTTSSAY